MKKKTLITSIAFLNLIGGAIGVEAIQQHPVYASYKIDGIPHPPAPPIINKPAEKTATPKEKAPVKGVPVKDQKTQPEKTTPKATKAPKPTQTPEKGTPTIEKTARVAKEVKKAPVKNQEKVALPQAAPTVAPKKVNKVLGSKVLGQMVTKTLPQTGTNLGLVTKIGGMMILAMATVIGFIKTNRQGEAK